MSAAPVPRPSAPGLDLTTLCIEHPVLAFQLQIEFMAEGAAAERERIRRVFEVGGSLRGYRDLTHQVAFVSLGTAEDLAVAMVNEERLARATLGRSVALAKAAFDVSLEAHK